MEVAATTSWSLGHELKESEGIRFLRIGLNLDESPDLVEGYTCTFAVTNKPGFAPGRLATMLVLLRRHHDGWSHGRCVS
jgi:hypothetical protein